MIVDDILANAETAVEALTATTDAGAPSGLVAVDTDDELEHAAQDRNFIIALEELGQRSVTSSTLAGTSDRWVSFSVVVKYINEGRSRRAFDSIVAQDAVRIMDRVQAYVREQSYAPSAVGECVHQSTRISRDSSTAGVYYVEHTFRAEYTDPIVLS